MEQRIVIGITGQPSSGKDTVANYVASLGFDHISTGDLIREEMSALGLSTDRTSISGFVTKARAERGNGYVAEIAIKKISGTVAVSGLRNIAEVEALRRAFGERFILWCIDAPIETRYQWALGRDRHGDQLTFEQFKIEEEAERSGRSDAHQVDEVVAMADLVITNDGTKEALLAKVDQLLAELHLV